MSNSCSHPCAVIDVLADVRDGVSINIFEKGLSIDLVIDVLTEASTNALDVSMVDGVDMLDGDLIILIGASTMTSGCTE